MSDEVILRGLLFLSTDNCDDADFSTLAVLLMPEC